MKKTISVLLALALTLSLGAAFAAGNGQPLPIPVPASLADPAFDHVTAELYPAAVQGTAYTDELALDVHWAESVHTRTDYQMILEPVQNSGQTAVYRYSGDIVRRSFGEDGELTEERWENRKAEGEAVFNLEEDDRISLRLTDVFAPELNVLCLQAADMPAPSAEELVSSVILPLAGLEEDTAGASLQAARLAAGFIRFAVRSRLYAVRPTALETSLVAALSGMNWNEKQFRCFSSREKAVASLMSVLSGAVCAEEDEFRPVRALMEDAGVWEEVSAFLEGGADVCSVAALTAQLDAVAEAAAG